MVHQEGTGAFRSDQTPTHASEKEPRCLKEQSSPIHQPPFKRHVHRPQPNRITSLLCRHVPQAAWKYGSMDLFVGTEDGRIHKCSMSYSEQYIETYEGHFGPVYAVRLNPFRSNLFLTCGADWTVQLWLSERPTSILTFHTTKEEISDLQWCPFQSTVFACITASGKIEVPHSVLDLGAPYSFRCGTLLSLQSSRLLIMSCRDVI